MQFIDWRARRARAVVGIAAILTSAGCTDTPVTPRPARMQPGASVANTVAAEPNWNHFSAHVRVTMTGGELTNAATLPPRVVALKLDRKLNDDGSWTYAMEYEPLTARGTLRQPYVRRVVGSSQGVRMFDANGAEVKRNTHASSIPSVLPTPPAGRSGDPRAWATQIVIGPRDRARVRAYLEKTYGAAVAQGNGRSVFRKQLGAGNALETVLDDERGVIREESTYAGAQRVMHVTHEYQEIQPRTYQKTVTRVEQQLDAKRRAVALEIRMSAVRFDQMEGSGND